MSTHPTPEAERRPPARLSVRVAVFLGAEALSAIGSWATIVVVWGYAAYTYHATAGDLGLFGVAFSAPAVLLGPLTGTVVDRVGAKATLALAKLVGIVAALSLVSAHSFRALALLSALNGIAFALATPALQSLPPRIVDEPLLARTNAMVALTDQLAIVLGPVVAGVAIAAVGFRGAFVFDAVTFAVGIAVLPLVRVRPARAADGDRDEHDGDEPTVRWRDTFDGWRLVARGGVLRRTVACTLVVHLLYGAAMLSEPLYVRDVLHRPPSTFAALQTAFGVFLVLGGIAAARVGDRLATFGWVALGVLASGVTAVVYLGTPWVPVAFLGVVLWGLATALLAGPSRTVLQRASPEHAHGRVLAADFVAGSSGELVGLGLASALVGAVGVRWSALFLGVGVTAIALLLIRSDRRDRRDGAGHRSATAEPAVPAPA